MLGATPDTTARATHGQVGGADTGGVSRLTSLRARHDPDTRRELVRARQALTAQVATHPAPTLSAAAAGLWPGWAPVDLGLDPATGAGEEGAMVWVYRHASRGWAVMFLNEAQTRWSANPRNAIKFATDFSASGTTLTTVCTRLLAMGAAIPDWSTQAVALLVTRPALQDELAAQRVQFLLAMTGLGDNLPAAAKGHGYGIPFAIP